MLAALFLLFCLIHGPSVDCWVINSRQWSLVNHHGGRFRLQSCRAEQSAAGPHPAVAQPSSDMDTFFEHLETSLKASDNFESMAFIENQMLNKSTLERSSEAALRSVTIRPVLLKKQPQAMFQVQYRYLTNDQTKNYDALTLLSVCRQLVTVVGFRKVTLLTTAQRHELAIRRDKQDHGIISSTCKRSKATPSGVVRSLAHDRQKTNHSMLLPSNTAFLQAVGMSTVNSDGTFRIKVDMLDKWKQVNKFVEILDHLVTRCHQQQQHGTTDGSPTAVQVMDLGCGKGYLTFAVHHHLQSILPIVRTTGVEVRPELAAAAEGIARQLDADGCTGLAFRQGSISSLSPAQLFQSNEDDGSSSRIMKVLLGLHACDTATDDLLWAGMQAFADIIVVAPCCQKQLRSQIDTSSPTSPALKEAGMDSILAHGIFRERCTEMTTDALRALCLQMAGYEVKVFEFIDKQSTAKNVMITAVKGHPQVGDVSKYREQLDRLVSSFGITKHRLLEKLGMLKQEDKLPALPTSRALLLRRRYDRER